MQVPLIQYLTAARRRFVRRPASIARPKPQPRLVERLPLGLPDSLPEPPAVPAQVQELLDFFQGELEEVTSC